MLKKTMGIDVDSRELNVCVLMDETRENSRWLKVKNTAQGFSQILEWAQKEKVEMIFMEATGGYEQAVALYLASHQVRVAIQNPHQVRQFARGIGLAWKNDAIDAFALGRMAQVVEVKPGVPLSANQLKLKQLATRRMQVVDMITIEKNHRTLAENETRESIDQHLEYLEKDQKTIDQLIEALIRKDPQLKEKRAVLVQFNGIGAVTAAYLLAFLPELGTVGNKQIARLAGLAPMDNDSGARKGKRHISGGRPRVRKALYMPGWVAVQRDQQMKQKYQKYLEEGKCKMVAIVAIMRKLLVRLNASLKRYLKKQSTQACPA